MSETGSGNRAERRSVTLIIANLNGKRHLQPCLDSIAALDYDRELIDVVVVDNASTDGSVEFLTERYPWVRVLPQDRNLGFAEAVNVAAAASRSECIALLNNDMRLDPGWLKGLVKAYAPADGYPCVAGLILDWEGDRIDFAEGFVNFHGAAAQGRFHESVDLVDVEDGRELLFACGGSMLVDRELFLALGGFDPAFFAYFEDVDFGWRLWLAGHKVRLAAGAVSFHRHHTTGAGFPLYQRALIFERNWLLMLIKNLDEPHVWRLLSAALLLLNQRVVLETGSRRSLFDPGRPAAADSEKVPRIALARIHAVADVVENLDAVLERRKTVQASRRRADKELFRFFERPFAPVREDAPYLDAMVRVSQALGLVELFPERRAVKLLVLSPADDARLWELAGAAARVLSVIYASPGGSRRSSDGFQSLELRSTSSARQLAAEVDFVLGSAGDAELAGVANDLHALLLIDVAGGGDALSRTEGLAELLAAADVVLCSSDAGREHAVALLQGAGASRPAVELVQPGSEASFFRRLSNEPWRWSHAQGRSGMPEDALALLTKWRNEYGVYRSPFWHLVRATWRLLPEATRVRVRPYLRLRGRFRRRA
ncbi:MAG: glycosyltransferase family 2 protein [Thermoleophilia bacterium]